MSRRPSLKVIASASPCRTRWADLPGTDRVRRCQSCGNCVYRLQGLSAGDSDALLTWTEGRAVQNLFVRQDGSFLAGDCAVGKRQAVERKQSQVRSRWAALALVASGLLGLAASAPEELPPSHEATPLAAMERSGPGPFAHAMPLERFRSR